MKRISRRDLVRSLAAAGAGAAVGGLLSAPALGQGPAAKPKTVSGPVNVLAKTVTNPVTIDYDLDGDGIKEYGIQTKLLMATFTGVMEGTGAGAQTVNAQDLRTGVSRTFATWTFWGTVGNSEPGTMMLHCMAVRLNQYHYITRYLVVDGSGIDGLEGITGGGDVEGHGPSGGPYVGSAKFEFRFNNASPTAALANP